MNSFFENFLNLRGNIKEEFFFFFDYLLCSVLLTVVYHFTIP